VYVCVGVQYVCVGVQYVCVGVLGSKRRECQTAANNGMDLCADRLQLAHLLT
jgi:hypothetical protein